MASIARALEQKLSAKNPCIILGPRGAGKTTLLRTLAGGASSFFWCDGDLPEDPIPKACETLILDEAVPGAFIQRLEERERPVRILAAASSSLAFPPGTEAFRLWPLSTAEMAKAQGWGKTLEAIETHLVFGPLPEVFARPQSARKLLIDHCRGFLFRDLVQHSGMRLTAKLERLAGILARRVGTPVTCDGLAREAGISKNTVIGYLRLLEACFIVRVCPSFASGLPHEMRKGKKVYFVDNGVRNALLRDFSPLPTRKDAAALWENFFFMERLKFQDLQESPADIRFWRTLGNSPRVVDFVEVLSGRPVRAFECRLEAQPLSRSARAFARNYPDCPVEVVTPRDLARLWRAPQGRSSSEKNDSDHSGA